MDFKKNLGIFLIRVKLNALFKLSRSLSGKAAYKIFCTPMRLAINKKITIFNGGKTLEFTVNKTVISGFVFNLAGTRKLLILHGFDSSCKNFHHYVSALVAAGCQVFAFDAPAHGASGGRQVNAVDYMQMIQKANDLYGPFDGFLAHSFGGLSVCLALEKMPHDAQTKLVLIAPATETTSAIDRAFTLLGLNNGDLKNALKKEIFNVSGHDAEWFSIRRAVKNITADILWVHDKDDTTTPLTDALEVQKDGQKNIRFMITEGLGHRMIYRNELVKDAAINFLC